MTDSTGSRLLARVRVRYEHWIFKIPGMGRYSGMVLYPYMMFRHDTYHTTGRLFRHELQHVYQIERWGWLRFYTKYLMETLRHGYKKNSFEVEARVMEVTPLSPAEGAVKRSGKKASIIGPLIVITMIVLAIVLITH